MNTGMVFMAVKPASGSRTFRDEIPVEPSKRLEQGYHLTEDLVDDAISWVNRRTIDQPDKPFFVYFATGAAHAPLHVSQKWADKFKGQFDQLRTKSVKKP